MLKPLGPLTLDLLISTSFPKSASEASPYQQPCLPISQSDWPPPLQYCTHLCLIHKSFHFPAFPISEDSKIIQGCIIMPCIHLAPEGSYRAQATWKWRGAFALLSVPHRYRTTVPTLRQSSRGLCRGTLQGKDDRCPASGRCKYDVTLKNSDFGLTEVLSLVLPARKRPHAIFSRFINQSNPLQRNPSSIFLPILTSEI